MTPVLVNVKFGNWNELLSEPEPQAANVYARLLYHFGRGMALSKKPKLKEAEAELAALRVLLQDPALKEPMTPFSAAIEGASVAEKILEGTIALRKEKYNEAIPAFQEAVEIEEGMVYNEPRDWMLNPRHYLGDALIKAGRPAEALTVLERDLANNQENGWALF
jgi:tetratricopeptide (TPR) repeat protein